jgi:hypothetical protein
VGRALRERQGNPMDEELQKDPVNKFKQFKEPHDGVVPEVNPTLANQFQNQPGALQALMLSALAVRAPVSRVCPPPWPPSSA